MIPQTTGANFPPMTGIRPSEIGTWMKTRGTWIEIAIEDINIFSEAWWTWWSALQPENRSQDTIPTVDMDWKKLRKTGKNGLPLVMLTLTWWGKASGCDEEWRRAVKDVHASINCMKDQCAGEARPSNVPLASSSIANSTTYSIAAGRPVRDRKRVRPRDEGYEGRPKKMVKSRR